MTYFNLVPLDGEWFVSEGFKSGRNPTGNDISQLADHNTGRDKMIVAGPFAPLRDAKIAMEQLRDVRAPYVWQHFEAAT